MFFFWIIIVAVFVLAASLCQFLQDKSIHHVEEPNDDQGDNQGDNLDGSHDEDDRPRA